MRSMMISMSIVMISMSIVMISVSGMMVSVCIVVVSMSIVMISSLRFRGSIEPWVWVSSVCGVMVSSVRDVVSVGVVMVSSVRGMVSVGVMVISSRFRARSLALPETRQFFIQLDDLAMTAPQLPIDPGGPLSARYRSRVRPVTPKMLVATNAVRWVRFRKSPSHCQWHWN